MAILQFRNTVIECIRANLVGNSKPFRSVGPSPRAVTPEWIAEVSRRAPAVMVAFIGIQRMERMPNGKFIGPLQMAAHVVAEDHANNPAHDAVVNLVEVLLNYIELNNFDVEGITPAAARNTTTPASIRTVEYQWDARLDNKGYAVASIMWDQPIIFGRSIASELAVADWHAPEDVVINQAVIAGTNTLTTASSSVIVPPPPLTNPGDYWKLG
jgi:hypothetical protein